MKVFLTVDVELWPLNWQSLTSADFEQAYERYILGKSRYGEYGLPYLLKKLNEYKLKAIFFVEPLFTGHDNHHPLLKKIIDLIRAHDQEVQLHLHSEWQNKFSPPILNKTYALHMNQLSLEQQITLVQIGKEKLIHAGAHKIIGFRAGNYGADYNTLKALKKNEILYDTSYNFCFLNKSCQLITPTPLCSPCQLESVCEIPITFFNEGFGRFRHAQLAACSTSEFKHLISQSIEQNRQSFVIVLHNFELFHVSTCKPDQVMISRFDELLDFLRKHEGLLYTSGFNELSQDSFLTESPTHVSELKGRFIHTAMRYKEQIQRRIFKG